VLVMFREDSYMLDVRIWVAVLVIQSIPYLASVLVSLMSAWQSLSARIVGVMSDMDCHDANGVHQPVSREG